MSIALVFVQGAFLNAKKVRTDYSAATGGALIYPSVRVEGSESATRHLARLITARRIEGEELEACIVVSDKGFAANRYYGTDEVAAFLTGRDYRVIGKAPSALRVAINKAKRADASTARKAAKLAAATLTAPVESESEVKA